jgi:DNA ligase (NAD+)
MQETTAKTLANAVNHLLDYKDFTLEQLQNLEDVGIKVASSIYRFFHDEDNIRLLERLEAAGISLKNQKRAVAGSDNLSGQSFLFTGTMMQLKRSDAEELVEKNGGKVVSGVSSKLNYLVVGADAGSKLEKAKRIHTIKIISEEDFIKMLPT